MQSDEPASPQTTPDSAQGSAKASRLTIAVAAAWSSAQTVRRAVEIIEEQISYTELVEALSSIISATDLYGTQGIEFFEARYAGLAVLAKIAIKEEKHEAENDKG